jgi:hypothetical protein
LGAPGGAGCSADRRKDPPNYVCTGMGCGGGDRHASRRADLEICARGITEEDLVSRREFLKLGALWVVSALGLLIAACGGGGGGEDTDRGGGGY